MFKAETSDESANVGKALDPRRSTLDRPLWYAAALVFFALGLMSKPAVVTLPCVMLLLDYWPLRRFTVNGSGFTFHALRLVMEKLPFFAMSAVLGWITVQSHAGLGMTQTVHGLPLLLRIENALVAYATYATKAMWPANLAILYPHPGEWPDAVVLGSLLLVCGLTVAAVWQMRRAPYLFVGWFWFIGVLTPTIGILQIGVQAMADRFTYVPVIGLFILVVWGGRELVNAVAQRQLAKVIGSGMAAGAVTVYGIVASNQLSHWQNSTTLFEHALRVTRDNFIIENNLGYTLMLAGRTNEALPHFEAALRIRPDFAEAALQAGEALAALNRTEEALAYLQRATELAPRWVTARTVYAEALRSAGRPSEAIAQYTALLANRPNAHTHALLAALYAENNQWREAVQHYHEGQRLSPDSPELLNNFAWLLATHPDDAARNGKEAVRLAERACELTKRRKPMFVGTLAAAYAEAGRFADAVRTGEEAAALAEAGGNKALADTNKALVALYRAGKPHRGKPQP